MIDRKRLLSHIHPELEEKDRFPVGFQFLQLYSRILVEKENKFVQPKDFDRIKVNKNKIPTTKFAPTFHKPITKCLVFKVKK